MVTASNATALGKSADAAGFRAHSSVAGAAHHGARSPVAEAERIDEAYLGHSRGNLADYAMRTGQMHQVAARKLRNIASISARDPRCICAMGTEGARTGIKLATSLQILGGFRIAVASIRVVPAPMRARLEAAKRLARASAVPMKQVAIVADVMAQDLYAHGDPQGAYQFAVISGQAVNRVVSTQARITAQLGKVELR